MKPMTLNLVYKFLPRPTGHVPFILDSPHQLITLLECLSTRKALSTTTMIQIILTMVQIIQKNQELHILINMFSLVEIAVWAQS